MSHTPKTSRNDAFALTIIVAYVLVVLPGTIVAVAVQSALQRTTRRAPRRRVRRLELSEAKS